jgi:hypothetical protein
LALSDDLLADLNPRSREIIQRRFGLLDDRAETLDKIGKRYGITRERVRQIISEALKSICAKTNNKSFLEAQERIIFTINQNNGIIQVNEIIEKFNSDGLQEANAIKFFAFCSKKITEAQDKGIFEKIWITTESVLPEVRNLLAEAEKIISQKNNLFTDNEIADLLSPIFPDFSAKKILNFLKISVKIKKNKFGKWGLKHWDQITPKGTRERVHLILKEHSRPMHFTEIAELIDKFQLGKRKAHPQTVHNELIKDERFVLIGRGIYVLREWGYFEGTIQDVIKTILIEKNKPLKKEEIIQEVLKIRQVKSTTISINLNNPRIFKKLGEAYTLK